MTEQRWLTIAEASKRVHRSRRTIERWIDAGRIRPVRLDGAEVGEPRLAVDENDLLRAERDARRANPARPRRRTINDVVS